MLYSLILSPFFNVTTSSKPSTPFSFLFIITPSNQTLTKTQPQKYRNIINKTPQDSNLDIKFQTKMSEEGKIVYHHHEKHHHDPESGQQFSPPPPPQYGTFQGVPSSPAMGFPQPAPPPGAIDAPAYYSRGYQAVPGYVVAEGRPMREPRLPCCGIGCGWFLFIIGFFLGGIPWYIGAIFLMCCKRSVDHREKPGYVACSIAAVVAIIATVFGVSRIND